jgi:hypothetical protein
LTNGSPNRVRPRSRGTKPECASSGPSCSGSRQCAPTAVRTSRHSSLSGTDGALHFCTGGEEQKALNLAANANVALTTGTNEWNAGVDVVVEGRAERVTDPDRLTTLAQAWQRKWDGQWTFSVIEGGFAHDAASTDVVHVYAVQPTRAYAFGKAPSSQTTYRFD